MALILMPEPFTTPFGLVLLGVAYTLSIPQRFDNRRQLRGLIKPYLNHTGKIIHHNPKQRLSDDDWREQPVVKVINHTIDSPRLLLRYGEMTSGATASQGDEPMRKLPVADKVIYHSLSRRLSGYVLPSEPMVPEKTVRHDFNVNRLQLDYERTLAGLATASRKSEAPQKAVSHRINQTRLLAHYQRGSMYTQPALAALSYN